MTTQRLFVALFAIALFTIAVRETVDPDMWWHLRTGAYILQEGFPRQDIFSFTVPTHSWVTHEWLSQIFMWGIYAWAGLPGLILIFALLIALSFWLVYTCCAGRPYLAAFVVLLAAFTSAIVWGARPQIFNLLLTAAFVHIVERYKNGDMSRKALWSLPVLTILWANLHSGYLLGIVLLCGYVVGESIQQLTGPVNSRSLEWSKIRQLLQVTLASFVVAVMNPNGPELWLYPFLTLSSPAMQAYIQEWHSPDFHLAQFWPFGLMMTLIIFSWRFSSRRPSWTEFLLFLGTAAAGLLSARHIPLFAIVSAPQLSLHAQSSFENSRLYHRPKGKSTRSLSTSTMDWLNGSVLLLMLLVAGVWTTAKLAINQSAVAAQYPVAAVDYLEESGLANERGYNSYNWGGYLIWRGLPVFIDGRADVYGDDFIFYYLKSFEARADWWEPLEAFGVKYVLMESGSPLTSLLSIHGEWEEVYGDQVAKVFVHGRQ